MSSFIEGQVNMPIPLLTSIVTTQVSAVERFVASEAFGDENPAGIRFFLWETFKKFFLKKKEENLPTAELAVKRLERRSQDDAIMKELGGYVETALGHIYELISRQPRGEGGDLMTDGKANIFYVRDSEGTLWALRAYWYSVDREWGLDAFAVDYCITS